jgi:antitoxin (DNA-binding transcriptional repressor) of toxin-antitoxin stability system
MKSVSLRTLVREPLKVKRLTRTGRPVQVTDNGRPLWIIHPAASPAQDEQRRRALEAELAAVSQEPESKLPLSRVILQSRR